MFLHALYESMLLKYVHLPERLSGILERLYRPALLHFLPDLVLPVGPAIIALFIDNMPVTVIRSLCHIGHKLLYLQ